MPLANGEVFAGYRILRPLGFGGMGEVYLVAHPRLPRQDALKILPAQMSADAGFRARFNREAELAATLYNPHIVGVHDRGEWAGQLWISMDYIDGPDAGRLLREQYPAGMPAGDVVEIVTAVADALDHAHDRGLLHRDVKPPNILLTRPERGRRRVLLADFGIARDSAEVSGLTETNMTLGTVNYAAPEQLMGAALDGRADQYGLAATAYHLLAGSPMFGSSNPAVVIGHHLNAPPPRLADVRPDLAALDPVLARALAKNPAARYRTCGELAAALRRAAGPAPSAPPTDPQPTDPQPTDPQPTSVLPAPVTAEPAAAGPAPRRFWAFAGLALVLVLAGLTFAVWPRPEHRSGPATAGTSSPRPSGTSAVPTSTAPRTSAVTTAGTTATRTTVTSSATTTAGGSALTFEGMRDLVVGFYARLPGNTAAAWNDLDAGYQQRHGLGGFTGFWSTVESVSVLSVTPRDATSVVARLRYVLRNGGTDTEDRWLSVVPGSGGLLIHDSERIGPA